ncbi:MAG: hypothetical protein LBC92_05475 [Rickettsiales bacterium]|nr:hypothetical protein [Rickettsiales bacterium]
MKIGNGQYQYARGFIDCEQMETIYRRAECRGRVMDKYKKFDKSNKCDTHTY